MTILKRLNACCLATFMAVTPFTSWADAGHDDGAAPGTAAGSAQPRFSAVSETFELVGVLKGKQLNLYLDRADDNSPVKEAQLELELGGAKVAVKPVGEGEFAATLTQELKPGVTSVAATVVAGQETDLLAGELDIRDGSHAAASAVSAPWRKYASWALGGLLVLTLLAWGLWRLRAYRINRIGGAA